MLQMTRGMRLRQTKQHVSHRIGATPLDLPAPVVMTDVGSELGFGRIHSYAISQPSQADQIEAKFNISKALELPINSVERFRERVEAL